jgi:hypothetical protein
MRTSRTSMTIEERPAPDADASITGTEGAWIDAFSPAADRRGLTVTGDQQLADSVLELCGVAAARESSSAVA